MTLLEQCQIWNENGEFQKIVDAIEALPQEEHTPELDSELGRAYNNLGNQDHPEYFSKALELLLPHETYFKEDHCWHFRTGYAYYYLNQEGPALRYFKRALELLPGDEDTQELIDDCRRCLTLPRFEKNFRERTAEAWAAFEAGEAELRRLMDQRDQKDVGEILVAKCHEMLAPAFQDIAFELGFNGAKYELILTPEGNRAKLFELDYFRRHAPASLQERWNIWVGRQPSKGFSLRYGGQEVSGSEVLVWVEAKGEKQVGLTLFCEALIPLLKEDEGRAWWFLTILTDQILGEIPAMALIDSFEVIDAPKAEPSVLLADLPETLSNMGYSLDTDAGRFLDNSYIGYRLEPSQDPDFDWRLDTYAGSTRCAALINEYLRGESQTMDAFHLDGVIAGFFIYPLDSFVGEDRSSAILDFRDALEAGILKTAGEDAFTFLGGATGLHYGYLDFIAWDLPAVFKAARPLFLDSPVQWANFHVFRRDVFTLSLVDKNVK